MMKPKRTVMTLSVGALVGGTAAYLFDPVQGRRRREACARRITRTIEDARHAKAKVDEIGSSLVADPDPTPIGLDSLGAGPPVAVPAS